MRKLVLVALNEFDPAFFRFATSRAELPGIERLLGSQHSNTWTHDEVEKRGLDPWVQWVSIHTGSDSADHKIKHLGHQFGDLGCHERLKGARRALSLLPP